MRALRSAVFALSLSGLACTTAKPTAAMPDLTPVPGTMTVGMASGAGDPAAQGAALAGWVQQASGMPARPAVFPDYDSLAAALAKGQVDVALVSPLAFVRAQDQGKPTSLGRTVRNGQSTYRAVLFAKSGSALKSIDDLKKAHELKAAWVDSSSATGYIFPKALLLQKQIDPAGLFKVQDFKGSHAEVCKGVASGAYDVGATYSDEPASAPAAHANGCDEALGADASKLQVIAATESIPNDMLAVKDGFDAALAKKLSDTAATANASDAGKAALKSAFQAEGFQPGDADLSAVRAALDTFHQKVP